jgi:glycosyltransferase involved in cell wall biosynthesis/predicted GH43/DUF377 family glycosyl hydrolase
MRQTVALCMIVRDEAEVIERCLRSVRGVIDSWVICDTGSVDDTVAVIEAVLGDLPGWLHRSEWRDFGTNRSELMARAHGVADYLLLLDADMTLRVVRPLGQLASDAYLLRHDGPLGYVVPRLVRGRRSWWFEGSTHEYLATEGAYTQELLESLIVEHHGDGGHRAEKLSRDRDLLEADLRRNLNDPRIVFYLAQTYRDLGEERRAIELYTRRGELGGWDEEAASALYQAGSLLAGGDPHAAIPLLLSAWQRCPARAEPLHELARICRFNGWHEAARAFAAHGLEMPFPDHGLFVYRWIYEWGLRYEFALAALATGDPAEAALAAEEVIHAGSIPSDVEHFLRERFDRPHGRGAPPLAELIPGIEVAEIRLDATPKWPQFNPTIAESEDGYVMIVRTANYRVENGHYVFLDDSEAIRTLNYLVKLDRGLQVVDVAAVEDAPDGPPRYPSRVKGYEDCRLVTAGGRWFATATVRDRNAHERCEVALLELAGSQIRAVRILRGPTPGRHEKNWMPFVIGSELRFVYSCGPTEVLRCDTDTGRVETVSRQPASAPAARFRGGSQGLATQNGLLFVVHETGDRDGPRSYQHRFVLLDDEYRLTAMSRPFHFVSPEIEFCAGLARRGGELLMTFGVGDHTAMLAVVDEASVLSALDS